MSEVERGERSVEHESAEKRHRRMLGRSDASKERLGAGKVERRERRRIAHKLVEQRHCFALVDRAVRAHTKAARC